MHWKLKIVNLINLSSLVALQVVIMTTYGATSDNKIVKLTMFCFQCCKVIIACNTAMTNGKTWVTRWTHKTHTISMG